MPRVKTTPIRVPRVREEIQEVFEQIMLELAAAEAKLLTATRAVEAGLAVAERTRLAAETAIAAAEAATAKADDTMKVYNTRLDMLTSVRPTMPPLEPIQHGFIHMDQSFVLYPSTIVLGALREPPAATPAYIKELLDRK